jgi:hypothetical protein
MAPLDGEMGEGPFLLIRTCELMGRVFPAVEPLRSSLAPDRYRGALTGALALGRPLSPFKTKSLRSHALDVLFERFHLRVAPLVFRLRIGGADFFQSLLDGEFGCFSHGDPPDPEHAERKPVKFMDVGPGVPLI